MNVQTIAPKDLVVQPKHFIPREHQALMVDHMLTHKEAMVIGGMGLGKTASTLSAIEELILTGQSKGALIVAPLRVTNLTWGNEAEKWSNFTWLTVANLRTEEGLQHWKDQSADIYLINFEQLYVKYTIKKKVLVNGKEVLVKTRVKVRGEDKYEIKLKPKTKNETVETGFCLTHLEGNYDLPVDTIVWDEISKAKDPSSKRINSFRRHRKKFKRHIGLTGTPASNGYLDIFAQIRLLDGGKRLGMAFSKFRDKYFESDYMGYKFTELEGSREAIQKLIADMTITLRSEDWLDIPPTILHDHEVTLTPAAKKKYKELEKELLIQLAEGEIEAINAAVLAGKLLQMTGGAVYDVDKKWRLLHDGKIKALAKIRTQLKKENKTVLVIFHYRHELTRLLQAFPEAELFTEARMDAWNRGEIPMMLANAQSIGHGLNLQYGGHNMVWFTLTYSRELYDQTNARLARTDQEHETVIHRILCSGTIDDAVAEALREKGETQSGLLLALKNLEYLNRQKYAK